MAAVQTAEEEDAALWQLWEVSLVPCSVGKEEADCRLHCDGHNLEIQLVDSAGRIEYL